MRSNRAVGALASVLIIAGVSSQVVNQQDQAARLHQRTLLESNRQALEQLPPTCNLIACVGLQGTLSCVLSAISAGDTPALRRCISGGIGEICSCAACIPQVNNFLQELGICVEQAVGDDEGVSSSHAFTISFQATRTSAPSLTRLPTRFDIWASTPTPTSEVDVGSGGTPVSTTAFEA